MEILLIGAICVACAALGFVAGVGLSKSYEDVLQAARRAVNVSGTSDAGNAIEELDTALRGVNR